MAMDEWRCWTDVGWCWGTGVRCGDDRDLLGSAGRVGQGAGALAEAKSRRMGRTAWQQGIRYRPGNFVRQCDDVRGWQQPVTRHESLNGQDADRRPRPDHSTAGHTGTCSDHSARRIPSTQKPSTAPVQPSRHVLGERRWDCRILWFGVCPDLLGSGGVRLAGRSPAA